MVWWTIDGVSIIRVDEYHAALHMKTASKHNTANKHQCLLVVGYIGSTKHFKCSNVLP